MPDNRKQTPLKKLFESTMFFLLVTGPLLACALLVVMIAVRSCRHIMGEDVPSWNMPLGPPYSRE